LFRNHFQFGDGKAVICGAGTHRAICFVSRESYVVAQLWLEINTTGSDPENLTSVVFRNCVVTIRAPQATLDVGLVCIAVRCGNLSKP
jgi:hypothetical protein